MSISGSKVISWVTGMISGGWEVKLGLAVTEDEEVALPWLLPIPPVSDSPRDRVGRLSPWLQVWLGKALWLQEGMVR